VQLKYPPACGVFRRAIIPAGFKLSCHKNQHPLGVCLYTLAFLLDDVFGSAYMHKFMYAKKQKLLAKNKQWSLQKAPRNILNPFFCVCTISSKTLLSSLVWEVESNILICSRCCLCRRLILKTDYFCSVSPPRGRFLRIMYETKQCCCCRGIKIKMLSRASQSGCAGNTSCDISTM
jgi:hypothetical protein